MDLRSRQNMTMLCDFYELTMGNGYFRSGIKDQITYFDLFFRQVPDGGGFAIAAGLEQVVDYISSLHFEPEDIDYLRSRGIFCEEFLDYLANFRFTGDIWAVPEGTPVFPREPLITVRAPAIQAQLVETYLLLAMNHQSLIATKASRIVRAAKGRAVMEFGSRRAQGADAAILGARAAYIAGCVGTACTISDQCYGVKALGTMAHSWVQMFDSEYEAFRTYCELYPGNAVLLVDTYDTLRSGIPNAIRAFNEVLKPMGITKCGIRLDSGDMSYLTQKARVMLDEAGWPGCTITCSNSLDEYIIQDLLLQGAKIDSFGVGERLITARSEPVFGGVYKLVAVEKNGEILQKKTLCVQEYMPLEDDPDIVVMFYNFYPNYDGETGTVSPMASTRPEKPGYLYMVFYQGEVRGMNVLETDDEITIDQEYTVRFSNPSNYTLLMVKRDRFSWMAMLGAAILMAGLVMAFYLRKR